MKKTISEIEKLAINRYSNFKALSREEQIRYFLRELRKMLDKKIHIEADIKDVLYYIKLNNYVIDNYAIKLIEDNNINKIELIKLMEEI